MTTQNIPLPAPVCEMLVLHGPFQIETALQALEQAGKNLDLQMQLSDSLDEARRLVQGINEAGLEENYAWSSGFGPHGAQARSDVLESLGLAEHSPDIDLSLAANALKKLLMS